MTQYKYHLNFFLAIQLCIWFKNKHKICKLSTHLQIIHIIHICRSSQLRMGCWRIFSEVYHSTAGQTDLARSCGEAGLWGGFSSTDLRQLGWVAHASEMCLCEDGKTLESLSGLSPSKIPWLTCKGSNMKCQCQSFSTLSSMKPGTSGD